MTIEEILNTEGYTPEEAQALIANPKYAGTLKKLVDQAEQGTTALLKAQELETSIKKFNDETVIPYGVKKDRETAEARGEAAKLREHLKAMKEAGYDVPESYFTAPADDTSKSKNDTASAVDGRYAGKDDLEKQGRAYMQLLSISEKARDLLGHGLDVEAEYDDFGKNRRPNEVLREYLDRKYDLTSKAKARDDEKEKKRLDAYADTKLDEWKKAHPQSENSELRPPAASKFDKFQSLPTEKKNSWQTVAGREQATIARQDKYKSLLVQ